MKERYPDAEPDDVLVLLPDELDALQEGEEITAVTLGGTRVAVDAETTEVSDGG